MYRKPIQVLDDEGRLLMNKLTKKTLTDPFCRMCSCASWLIR